jgi:hypothetical protein
LEGGDPICADRQHVDRAHLDVAAGRRDLAEGQDERADVTAALPEDHHEPVGRLDLVDDLHAEIRECPLQCARPLDETNQRDVDAVDRHRVRVHRAERGDGVTRLGHRLRP